MIKKTKIAKRETIGLPEFFSGRELELKELMDWVKLIFVIPFFFRVGERKKIFSIK